MQIKTTEGTVLLPYECSFDDKGDFFVIYCEGNHLATISRKIVQWIFMNDTIEVIDEPNDFGW